MTVLLVAVLAASLAATASPSSSPEAAARRFLDAYAGGDTAALDRMIEPSVTVYGGDVAEVAHGRSELHAMLGRDLQLWRGPAHLGTMDHVSLVEGRDLAALTFDAPFNVEGGRPVTVRFSMVLRRHGGAWRLASSANATPTTGQSAKDLLAAQPAR